MVGNPHHHVFLLSHFFFPKSLKEVYLSHWKPHLNKYRKTVFSQIIIKISVWIKIEFGLDNLMVISGVKVYLSISTYYYLE